MKLFSAPQLMLVRFMRWSYIYKFRGVWSIVFDVMNRSFARFSYEKPEYRISRVMYVQKRNLNSCQILYVSFMKGLSIVFQG